jgi:chlorite dismutase
MAPPLLVSFAGGDDGPWSVDRITVVVGTGLPDARRLAIHEGVGQPSSPAAWTLRGTTSNERYVERSERMSLVDRQEGLGRPHATCAALIPITKRTEWWDLTQDERRAIFEARSHHIAIGLDYLPAIARRLHHGRELGQEFDFLTWFEFSSVDAAAFEDLVGRLRETEEWAYVEREVDIRLSR